MSPDPTPATTTPSASAKPLAARHRWAILLWSLAAITVAARLFAPAGWIEAIWWRHIFRPVARLLVPLAAAVPFSLTEALVLPLTWLLVARIRSRWRGSIGQIWHRRLWRALGPLGWTALLGYVTFTVLWGFNYARPAIEQRARLEGAEPSREEFEKLTDRTIARVNELVPAAHRADPGRAESIAAARLAEVVEQIDQVTPTLPARAKRIYPPGLLTTFGVVGVTSPWLLEGHIDPSILEIEQPFTAAHEIAHVAGFAPEGDASFLAFLACRSSGDALAEYSAQLGLLRLILRRTGGLARRTLVARLSPAVQADLSGIRKRARQYRWEPAARLQSRVYDGYLHTQSVKLGLDDYGRVIELLIRWDRTRAR